MCGITGILQARRSDFPAEEVAQQIALMTRSLAHRGPDGEGLWVGTRAALGHRRLAIIDVASGAQPMATADDRLQVCFNGEIYNHHRLRAELEAKGHRFRTHCDTEVLLHGYREWGTGLPARLSGMFAFLVHDTETGETLIARDPLGKKPLYHGEHEGRLYLASEARAMLSLEGWPRGLDLSRIGIFLALRYLPGAATLLEGLQQVPAGHLALHRPGQGLETRPYWQLSWDKHEASFDEAVPELRSLFMDAVSGRLESEVPLGAFLSGGVDSSGVVAAMHELRGSDVHAVTVGFEDPRFDETPHALDLAGRLGIQLETERLEPDPARDLPALAELLDLPFSDSSAWPTLLVCEAARRHVTVALSGDGGDENFGGYRRYRFDLMESGFRFVPAPLARIAGGLYPKADWLPRPMRLKRTLQDLGLPREEAYFRSVSAMLPEEVEQLCAPIREGLRDPFEDLRELYHGSKASNHMDRIMDVDLKSYLTGDILTKVDRCSMQNGLEVRSPILDKKVVEFAASMPFAYKLDVRRGKKLLKAAFEPWLGKEWMERPKQGFSIPLSDWLRGPLRERRDEALHGDLASELFDSRVLEKWSRQHDSGIRDRSEPLWAVLVLDLWQERWGRGP